MTRSARTLIATCLVLAVPAFVGCSKDSATPDLTTTAPSGAATAAASGLAKTTASATPSGGAVAAVASGAVAPAASSGGAVAVASGATSGAAMMPVAPTTGGAEGTYTPFKHPKGFSLDVPSMFTASASKNPDAATWTFGAATMKADVSPNLSETIEALFEEAAKTPGVTDKQKKDNWYTLKGSNKGKSFFKKTFVSPASVTSLVILYDDALKAQLDPVAQHVADSFKPKS